VNLLNFGITLKELRTKSHMTQKQLAEQMGVTKSVVCYYEQQERYPSPEVLIKLSSIFHVSTDYLLGIDKKEYVDISGLEPSDIVMVTELIQHLRAKNQTINKAQK
jgi:transcriptional regulator with XRE-family HTH domain